MRNAVIFIAALSIGLGGCESRPGQDGDDTSVEVADTAATTHGDERRPSKDEAADASASLGVNLVTLLEGADSRDPDTQQLRILDRLNEPDSISIDTQVNRHNPSQVDTLRTLHFDDARITVYEVSGGKELLKNVTVTGSGLDSPEGVRIGMAREEVERALGEADDEQNGALVYVDDGPMPTQLYVYFRNEEAGRMEWLFPID